MATDDLIRWLSEWKSYLEHTSKLISGGNVYTTCQRRLLIHGAFYVTSSPTRPCMLPLLLRLHDSTLHLLDVTPKPSHLILKASFGRRLHSTCYGGDFIVLPQWPLHW
jgi:hypothetical protein